MTQNAIIYARFSSTEQSKGYSLERQLTHGKEYVERMGWNFERSITDEGRSAFHGTNRLEGSSLFALEAEARNGIHRGKVLCVENIDRLSRQGAKAAAQLVWALNEAGVDVATWHDGYVYKAGNNGDMMELFSVIIKAQLAYEESLKKSQRTSASWGKRYQRIADGDKTLMVGRCPAWIVPTEDGYRLNKHRVSVLNEIYDLYIEGVGIYLITQRLNERGEPAWSDKKTKYDGGWYPAYLHRLLTARVVLGEYVTLKGETLSTDFFPQAVTAEKFLRAQATRDTRRNTGGRDVTKVNNLLSGIVYCSECGRRAGYENKGTVRRKYTTKAGELRVYSGKTHERLRCDVNRRKNGCSNNAIVDYAVVEATILQGLLPDLIANPAQDPAIAKHREQLAELLRQRDDTQARLNKLIDILEGDGGEPDPDIMMRVKTRRTELNDLNEKIETEQHRLNVELTKPSVRDDLALIASLRDDLVSKDDDIRFYTRKRVNQSLLRLITKVSIQPTGLFEILVDQTTYIFDETGGLVEDWTILSAAE